MTETNKPTSQELLQALHSRQSQDYRTAKITELTATILLFLKQAEPMYNGLEPEEVAANLVALISTIQEDSATFYRVAPAITILSNYINE